MLMTLSFLTNVSNSAYSNSYTAPDVFFNFNGASTIPKLFRKVWSVDVGHKQSNRDMF